MTEAGGVADRGPGGVPAGYRLLDGPPPLADYPSRAGQRFGVMLNVVRTSPEHTARRADLAASSTTSRLRD